ncbi:MAG: tyrosine-type recombinase/integrase [Prevotella shahii]|jgi:integrase/recombinase xerD|uniref:tyrosine-type recombinase/integrase n=1 Tax=Hoylesella shahii TaxID=228603 RepID=UPI001CB5F2E9|nr:tyrosine-type recombinase/integrase [Hoylesella shahii]MBF1569710.1 tyrosine-type recombinase/integrase [Hoylesella shahii]
MTTEQFLNYLQYELNRSELTIVSYGDDLRAFKAFFKNKDTLLTWEAVDADLIRDWMESMMDKGCSATTIQRRLSALRSFYRFGLTRGYVTKNPARGIVGPKRSRPLPQFLRESEMNRLLDDVPVGDSYRELLGYIIVLVFYSTGMRLAELVGLDDDNIDFDTRVIKVLGKGSKQRLIPFADELEEGLKIYVARRDAEVVRKDKAFFVDQRGQRVKRGAVQNSVRASLAKVTSMKKRSPHVLRHTFATAMLNNEAGLESVKKLLGHESLSTTEIYTHTTFEQLKKIYDKAHPRA